MSEEVSCFEIAKWHYLYPYQVRDIIRQYSIPICREESSHFGMPANLFITKEEYKKNTERFKSVKIISKEPPTEKDLHKQSRELTPLERAWKTVPKILEDLKSKVDNFINLNAVLSKLGLPQNIKTRDKLRKRLQMLGLTLEKRGMYWYVKEDDFNNLSQKEKEKIAYHVQNGVYV